jgi:hypothetical protein
MNLHELHQYEQIMVDSPGNLLNQMDHITNQLVPLTFLESLCLAEVHHPYIDHIYPGSLASRIICVYVITQFTLPIFSKRYNSETLLQKVS